MKYNNSMNIHGLDRLFSFIVGREKGTPRGNHWRYIDNVQCIYSQTCLWRPLKGILKKVAY